MKLFEATRKLFTDKSIFSTLLDQVHALALTLGVFLIVGFFFIFKPIILLYLLIAGMLVAGWFMLYFIFPDLHSWTQIHQKNLMKKLRHFFGKI